MWEGQWFTGVGHTRICQNPRASLAGPIFLLMPIWDMTRWLEDLALGSLLCWTSLPLIGFLLHKTHCMQLPVDLNFVLQWRQAIDKILAPCYKLCALSFPLNGPAFMFGDSKSVVLCSTIPTCGLNKRHNFLAHCRVKECIVAASGGEPIVRFFDINGKPSGHPDQDPSRCCSDIYCHMKPWLHWV